MGFLNNMLQTKQKLFFVFLFLLTTPVFSQEVLMLNEKTDKYAVK